MSSLSGRSTSGRVQALAATLQDTNHNLRAVEKMLRDLSSERSKDQCRPHSSTGLESGSRVNQRPEEENKRNGGVTSDKEGYGAGRYDPRVGGEDNGRSRTQLRQFYDDSSTDLHSFHQSLRDLSAEQRLLAAELKQEREQRVTIKTVDKNWNKPIEDGIINRVDQRLQNIEANLCSERDRWDRQQENMIRISLELKEALERHQLVERERNLLENEKKKEGGSERDALKSALDEQSEQLKEYLNIVIERNKTEQELNNLRQKVEELSRIGGQVDGVPQIAEATNQRPYGGSMRGQVGLQRVLDQGRSGVRIGAGDICTEDLDEFRHFSELKNDVSTSCESLWRIKNEKLKQEVDWCKERLSDTEKQRDELKHDLETQRSRSAVLQQQLDRLLLEFNNLMSVRIELDEKLTSRDYRLNEALVAKSALEREVRDCRTSVATMEKELDQLQTREREAREAVERETVRVKTLEAVAINKAHSENDEKSKLQREAETEIERLRTQRDDLLSKLAGMSAENGELKSSLDRLQKGCDASRQEVEHLRQQVRSQEDVKQYSDALGRYKAEVARLLAELEGAKLAAKEERSINKLQKKKEVKLKQELEEMQGKLKQARNDFETIEQRYHQLRKELATSAMAAEDGWAKNKEVELELIDAHDALVRAAQNHCNELHTIDADVEALICCLPDGVRDDTASDKYFASSRSNNRTSIIRNKLFRLRTILQDVKLQPVHGNKDAINHDENSIGNRNDRIDTFSAEKNGVNSEDVINCGFGEGDGLKNYNANPRIPYSNAYDNESSLRNYTKSSERISTGSGWGKEQTLQKKYLHSDNENCSRESDIILSPTRSRSLSRDKQRSRASFGSLTRMENQESRTRSNIKMADSSEEINMRYKRLKATMQALQEDLANAKLFSNLYGDSDVDRKLKESA